MINVLVQQEKKSSTSNKIAYQNDQFFNLLLSFDDVLEDLGYFCDHGYEEGVVCLVHEPFVILHLVVELLLDVVFHLVRYEPAGNLIGHLAEQSEIIWGKVLITLFVCNLKYTDGMISKLDWDQEHISYDLMQLLVHRHVLAELIPHIIILSSFEVTRLARVKHLTENVGIIALSLEADWFSQAPRNNFTEKLIFDTVIQEDRAALDV